MRRPTEEALTGLPLAAEANDEMLFLSVWLALAIGGVLCALSWRGRQWWLLTWSVGLVGCSLAYLGWALMAGRTG